MKSFSHSVRGAFHVCSHEASLFRTTTMKVLPLLLLLSAGIFAEKITLLEDKDVTFDSGNAFVLFMMRTLNALPEAQKLLKQGPYWKDFSETVSSLEPDVIVPETLFNSSSVFKSEESICHQLSGFSNFLVAKGNTFLFVYEAIPTGINWEDSLQAVFMASFDPCFAFPYVSNAEKRVSKVYEFPVPGCHSTLHVATYQAHSERVILSEYEDVEFESSSHYALFVMRLLNRLPLSRKLLEKNIAKEHRVPFFATVENKDPHVMVPAQFLPRDMNILSLHRDLTDFTTQLFSKDDKKLARFFYEEIPEDVDWKDTEAFFVLSFNPDFKFPDIVGSIKRVGKIESIEVGASTLLIASYQKSSRTFFGISVVAVFIGAALAAVAYWIYAAKKAPEDEEESVSKEEVSKEDPRKTPSEASLDLIDQHK